MLLSHQVILKSEPVHPFGLAVYGEHIFWTDWVRRAVQRANKYVGSDMKLLRVDIPQQPMGIIAVANDTNSCEWGYHPHCSPDLCLHTCAHDSLVSPRTSSIQIPLHTFGTQKLLKPQHSSNPAPSRHLCTYMDLIYSGPSHANCTHEHTRARAHTHMHTHIHTVRGSRRVPIPEDPITLPNNSIYLEPPSYQV